MPDQAWILRLSLWTVRLLEKETMAGGAGGAHDEVTVVFLASRSHRPPSSTLPSADSSAPSPAPPLRCSAPSPPPLLPALSPRNRHLLRPLTVPKSMAGLLPSSHHLGGRCSGCFHYRLRNCRLLPPQRPCGAGSARPACTWFSALCPSERRLCPQLPRPALRPSLPSFRSLGH